jgi:hypothetical protein
MSGVKVRVMGYQSQIFEVSVPGTVVEAAGGLLHSPERYFEIGDSVLVPLTKLIFSRARFDGISNAVKLMSLAYNGKQPRRAPLNIRRFDNEHYLVLDGNSTGIVAVVAGWPVVPCLIAEK